MISRGNCFTLNISEAFSRHPHCLGAGGGRACELPRSHFLMWELALPLASGQVT